MLNAVLRNELRLNTHGHLPDEWITQPCQINDIEPQIEEHDAYREAARKGIRILNAAFAHIEAALARPGSTKQDIAVAFWQPAYAMGLNICEGKSVTSRASDLGVKRATLSKGMTAFCNGNNLTPSGYMKGEDATPAYRKARIESIERNGQH